MCCTTVVENSWVKGAFVPLPCVESRRLQWVCSNQGGPCMAFRHEEEHRTRWQCLLPSTHLSLGQPLPTVLPPTLKNLIAWAGALTVGQISDASSWQWCPVLTNTGLSTGAACFPPLLVYLVALRIGPLVFSKLISFNVWVALWTKTGNTSVSTSMLFVYYFFKNHTPFFCPIGATRMSCSI